MKILKKILPPLSALILTGLSAHSFAQQTSLDRNGSNAPNSLNSLNSPNSPNSNNIRNAERVFSLNELMADKVLGGTGFKSDKPEINEMRKAALSEVAVSLGASAGLTSKTSEIKAVLDKQALYLDKIFDFSRMLVTDGVLAPVLSEGLANYVQENENQVRIADKIYKIESRARFVSVYPTWRDYLQFSFKSFEIPPQGYLPKNDAEKVFWDEWVKKGWSQGEHQALTIFESSMGRLRRDFTGMIRYKSLTAQGLITKPIIAKANLGITGGGNEMAINEQVFRIVDHSALIPNKNEWKVDYPVSNYDGKKYQ